MQKVLHATSTFISSILPFTSVVLASLSKDIDSASSNPKSRSRFHQSCPQYDKAGGDVVLRTPLCPPRRKGSWISRPHSTGRKQSCRRVNFRRDWSGELEESDYRLPFLVGVEEIERGGRQIVSF